MPEQPIIQLYSASRQRSKMLKSVGIPFLAQGMDVDENLPPDSNYKDAVLEIARRKINAGLNQSNVNRQQWGLAADTLLESKSGLLGKAKNKTAAKEMLLELSGSRHLVHTAIVLYAPDQQGDQSTVFTGKICEEIHSTEIVFRNLTQKEINRYLITGEWRGVAGAYRIQGRGAFFVKSIKGLWSTVAGLPLSPLYGMLSSCFYPFG